VTARIAAVDLGASAGRVVVGELSGDRLDVREVARFDNVPVRVDGVLHWDVLRLYQSILDGLRQAGPVDSVGVDSWGVDYALLDADGRLLANPVHYRDARTAGVMERVLATVKSAELYACTGIQFLPLNTVYQLVAAAGDAQLDAARTVLLIPDLITYWLTGTVGAELTNASTTQLLNIHTGQWAGDIMRRLGIRRELFPRVRWPGDQLGRLRPDVATATGLDPATKVIAVGSHDTASAVAAVPARDERFAYVSCGTWSLVGVELDRPVLTPPSRLANFSNEVGVDGTIRYLRNVMGLWLLQESLRTWRAAGSTPSLPALLRDAARRPALACVVDAGDHEFLAPGDMPARIAAAAGRRDQSPPETPAAVVRCIVDSLALAHRAALIDAERLSGREVDVVHMVGGGARNELLCQLTADATGRPVEAGPDEASAIGNLLVQARTLGSVGPDLGAMRALARTAQPIRRYEPRGRPVAWERAASRLAG